MTAYHRRRRRDPMELLGWVGLWASLIGILVFISWALSKLIP